MSKILYAASSYSHIKNFHLPYIEALRAQGHEVLVMARGEGADFDIPFEKKLLSPKSTACRRMIREILKRERFDAVILNTTLAAVHVRLAMPRRARPRCINIVHGYLFRRRGGIKDKILRFCERFLWKKTDIILVMNGEDYKICAEYKLSREGCMMTLGMGAKCSPERARREEIRRELGLGEAYLLTFVGELSARKNQRALIEAVAALREDIPNVALALVGDGGLREEYAALAERLGVGDRVVFTGNRPNPCDFIRASDIYISASKIEGMPFNIIEAMGTCTPVVASSTKGHDDVISDRVNGYLFSLREPCRLGEIGKGIHSGTLTVSEEAMHEVYGKYCFENVFPRTYLAIEEALGYDKK